MPNPAWFRRGSKFFDPQMWSTLVGRGPEEVAPLWLKERIIGTGQEGAFPSAVRRYFESSPEPFNLPPLGPRNPNFVTGQQLPNYPLTRATRLDKIMKLGEFLKRGSGKYLPGQEGFFIHRSAMHRESADWEEEFFLRNLKSGSSWDILLVNDRGSGVWDVGVVGYGPKGDVLRERLQPGTIRSVMREIGQVIPAVAFRGGGSSRTRMEKGPLWGRMMGENVYPKPPLGGPGREPPRLPGPPMFPGAGR